MRASPDGGLRIWLRGAFENIDSFVGIHVDGVYLRSWGSRTDCRERGPSSTTLEIPIDAAFADDGRVTVSLRGSPQLCASCNDLVGCPHGNECAGNDALIHLQNRTRVYRGLMGDDEVCKK